MSSRSFVTALVLVTITAAFSFAQSGSARSSFTLSVEIPAHLEVRDAAFAFERTGSDAFSWNSAWQTVAHANAHWRVDLQLQPLRQLVGLSLVPVETRYTVEVRVNGVVTVYSFLVTAEDKPVPAALQMQPVPHEGVIGMRLAVVAVSAPADAQIDAPASPAMTFSVHSF
jgi:hypothetical protein